MCPHLQAARSASPNRRFVEQGIMNLERVGDKLVALYIAVCLILINLAPTRCKTSRVFDPLMEMWSHVYFHFAVYRRGVLTSPSAIQCYDMKPRTFMLPYREKVHGAVSIVLLLQQHK